MINNIYYFLLIRKIKHEQKCVFNVLLTKGFQLKSVKLYCIMLCVNVINQSLQIRQFTVSNSFILLILVYKVQLYAENWRFDVLNWFTLHKQTWTLDSRNGKAIISFSNKIGKVITNLRSPSSTGILLGNFYLDTVLLARFSAFLKPAVKSVLRFIINGCIWYSAHSQLSLCNTQ